MHTSVYKDGRGGHQVHAGGELANWNWEVGGVWVWVWVVCGSDELGRPIVGLRAMRRGPCRRSSSVLLSRSSRNNLYKDRVMERASLPSSHPAH